MSGPQPQIQPQPEGPTKVVGTKVRRIDAVDKAAGSTRFGSDTARPPGLLHAKVLTSTEAHAQIVGIDTSKAEALKGVRAIVTEADFTSEMFGVLLNDQPPLARGKVRFYGEPVAAVAADTEEIAEEALELIKVTYKPLETFLDRRDRSGGRWGADSWVEGRVQDSRAAQSARGKSPRCDSRRKRRCRQGVPAGPQDL